MIFTVRFTPYGKVHEVGRDFDAFLNGETKPGDSTICGEWVGGSTVYEGKPSDVTCRKCHPLPRVYRNGVRIQ